MNVAALLSGGVDSSVAVHLLTEQGIHPDLFYIKIGMDTSEGYSCPQEEDLEMVKAMARRYGLSFDIVDLQKEYWDGVVSYTIERVRHGLTPNPDVMCNRLIKFGAFDQKIGHTYDKTATGHYATTLTGNPSLEAGVFTVAPEPSSSTVWLGTTPDPVKDQTDFLAQLQGWQVAHTLFPIGHLQKEEVRRIAEAAHLPSAHRKDSQGICFLGKIDYNGFIERFLGKKEGPIVELETGKVLGHHQGFWFHTIGQRKGLYLSGGPWFVVKKDIEENVIYVSRGYQPEAQMRDHLTVRAMHWITLDPFAAVASSSSDRSAYVTSLPVLFKIRHVAELRPATLSLLPDGAGHYLAMQSPINGVAPGQFCVVYTPDGRVCLGSGEIGWE